MLDSPVQPPVAVLGAVEDDLDALAALFDAYRGFYEQSRVLDAARRFVAARLASSDTRFFIARCDGDACGFVHLLPSFDTLAMRPMFVLEDLFVAPEHRRRGVGSALLRHAEAFARETGASRLSLTTAHENVIAQRLYEAHGYVLDTVFRTYHRSVS